MRRIRRKARRKAMNHKVILRTKIRKKRMRRTLSALGLISLIGIFAIASFFYVDLCLEYILGSDSFKVREIAITGNAVLKEDIILAFFSLIYRTPTGRRPITGLSPMRAGWA